MLPEINYSRTYYFGTRGRPGHWLVDEQRRSVDTNHKYGEDFRFDWPGPWHHIDGVLNPSERQGEAALHHKDGWTALAFANRTDDKRGGSNSVFFFDALLTFDEAVAAAKKAWPDVTKFEFEIVPTKRKRCAVGTCRRWASTTLSKDDVTLALCVRHIGAYQRQGYEEAESVA